MQDRITLDRLADARGRPVYDPSGAKIGKVEDIYYDEQTSTPEWIGIGTGFLGTKRVVVPVEGSELTYDGYTVPYDKEIVKDSPEIDADEISPQTESELYSYYGLEAGAGRLDAASDRGARWRAEKTEGRGYVTRSEEELQVGKRDVDVGRARLRKWVETEPVQTDVELEHETARVVRKPVNETVSDADMGEEQVEVRLRRQEPVVAKQTVAKERIGLEKDVQRERRKVGDDVRKERVEIERDDVDDTGVGG